MTKQEFIKKYEAMAVVFCSGKDAVLFNHEVKKVANWAHHEECDNNLMNICEREDIYIIFKDGVIGFDKLDRLLLIRYCDFDIKGCDFDIKGIVFFTPEDIIDTHKYRIGEELLTTLLTDHLVVTKLNEDGTYNIRYKNKSNEESCFFWKESSRDGYLEVDWTKEAMPVSFQSSSLIGQKFETSGIGLPQLEVIKDNGDGTYLAKWTANNTVSVFVWELRDGKLEPVKEHIIKNLIIDVVAQTVDGLIVYKKIIPLYTLTTSQEISKMVSAYLDTIKGAVHTCNIKLEDK